jgi:chromosome segregation protein
MAALEARAVAARSGRSAAFGVVGLAREAWQAARRDARSAEEGVADERRELAVLQARVAQLEAEMPARQRAIEALDDERAVAAEAGDGARSTDELAAASRAAAEAAREDARRALLELERQTGDGVARLMELERAAQAAAIEVSRHEETLASLARERELALESLPAEASGEEAAADAPVEGPEGEDVSGLTDEAIETELRRVRRTLAQIGSVNPFAVEEHRELAGRLDELTTQDTDLSQAIASTDELIARLDADIGEQFDAAFAAIGERFDEFCRLLFAGGSASLHIGDGTDGEAPGGIEIVVRPPGKRLQRLAMLSGGERALTGVALLFAMLSVNPVPFCILDEVDAALDEANIGRFADALRKLSESIDFVVITHNRATIEVADTIYGVTMSDAAVSRTVSLRLADLPAEAFVG